MAMTRGVYRARQFWQALWAKPKPGQLEFARQILTSAQFELFQQLQPSEKAHALSVCQGLSAQGEDDPDLLIAALLHDIGKVPHPLRVWDRVVVVLGLKIFPQQAVLWGQGEPKGWRRPFVVAAKHPAWGAEMVQEAGASHLVLTLIRYHQDEAPTDLGQEERSLLSNLQAVDNNK
jgi:hypothetical protein